MDAAETENHGLLENISLKEEGLGDRLFLPRLKRRWGGRGDLCDIPGNSQSSQSSLACGIPHTFLYPSEKQLLPHGSRRLPQADYCPKKPADYMAAAVVVARNP